MVLSHSKKFIFIHVYKVAGTSISKELVKYSGLFLPTIRGYRYISRKFPKIFPNKYHRHIYAKELKTVLPEKTFNSYYKFAFVRNPWDWHVSQYHYILRKKNHHQHEFIKSLNGFKGYIEWVVTTNITTQMDMLSDENGNLLMDFVGKYENLNEDFDKICDHIGIKRANLPHLNQTKKKSYQEYYDEEAKNLIFNAYRADIEAFDYEF